MDTETHVVGDDMVKTQSIGDDESAIHMHRDRK